MCEDNGTCIRVIETGRNPTMRHIGRTHKVDLRFVHERFAGGDMLMGWTDTERQSADIITKASTAALEWKHVRALICTSNKLDECFQAISGSTPPGWNDSSPHGQGQCDDQNGVEGAERSRRSDGRLRVHNGATRGFFGHSCRGQP